MPTQRITQFDGGLTDNFVGAEPNTWKKADGLVLTSDYRLDSFEGSDFDVRTPDGFRTPSTALDGAATLFTRRIGALFTIDDVVFKQVSKRVYYDLDGEMNSVIAVDGVVGVDIFSELTQETTTISYSRWLKQVLATTDALNSRPIAWFNYTNVDGGIILIGGDSAQLAISLGLPQPSGGVAPTSVGGVRNYAYVWKYTYTTLDGNTFLVRSRPVYFLLLSDVSTVNIRNFAVANSSEGTLYPVGDPNFILEVYETEDNGTVYYKVSDDSTGFQNGALSLAAPIAEVNTSTQETLYTTGGVAENWKPPTCKYIHSTTNFTYFAHGYDILPGTVDAPTDVNGSLYENRVWQCKFGDPHAVPQSFFVDVEEPIVGISSVHSIPIVFCENSIYRIDGYFDDSGRQGMVTQKISDSVGGAGQLNIVQTIEGLYFAGTDGFYFTDGQKVISVSDEIRTTYAQFVTTSLKKKRIYGTHDAKNHRVYWAVRANELEGPLSENNGIVILDTRIKKIIGVRTSGYTGTGAFILATAGTVTASSTSITGLYDSPPIGSAALGDGIPANALVKSVSGSGPYTAVLTKAPTVSFSVSPASTSTLLKFVEDTDDLRGISCFETFLPSAICVLDHRLYRADPRGYTFKSKLSTVGGQYDQRIDTSVSNPALILTQPIFYNYESSALDFGMTDRKYGNGLVTAFRSKTAVASDLSVQIKNENDFNGSPQDMGLVRELLCPLWGSLTYGDPALWQNQSKVLVYKRRFPYGSLRYSYKQVHLTNGIVVITDSDNTALGTLSGSGQVRTLTLASTVWAKNVEDYYISLADDSYVNKYRIISRDSNTAVSIFVGNTAVTNASGKKWQISGIKKGDVISLIELAIDFTPMGGTQTPFQGSTTTGGNV